MENLLEITYLENIQSLKNASCHIVRISDRLLFISGYINIQNNGGSISGSIFKLPDNIPIFTESQVFITAQNYLNSIDRYPIRYTSNTRTIDADINSGIGLKIFGTVFI